MYVRSVGSGALPFLALLFALLICHVVVDVVGVSFLAVPRQVKVSQTRDRFLDDSHRVRKTLIPVDAALARLYAF